MILHYFEDDNSAENQREYVPLAFGGRAWAAYMSVETLRYRRCNVIWGRLIGDRTPHGWSNDESNEPD
jgi:hypothetical protein